MRKGLHLAAVSSERAGMEEKQLGREHGGRSLGSRPAPYLPGRDPGVLASLPAPISWAGIQVGLCVPPPPSHHGLKGSGCSPAWLGRHEEERAHAVPLLPAACGPGKDRASGSASPPQDGDGGTG